MRGGRKRGEPRKRKRKGSCGVGWGGSLNSGSKVNSQCRIFLESLKPERGSEAQMRLLLTTEVIYFQVSGAVFKVLQYHIESRDFSRISGL